MKNILVIDDNEDYRKMLKIFIEKEGYNVSEVSNGRKGYEHFTNNKEKYNLIITDLFMPEIDGVQVAHLIKEDFPETKIIAITGGGCSDGRTDYLLERAKFHGADEVYHKCESIQKLISMIKKLMSKAF